METPVTRQDYLINLKIQLPIREKHLIAVVKRLKCWKSKQCHCAMTFCEIVQVVSE